MGKKKINFNIRGKRIKEYVYLDGIEINSLLAQFEDGIPQVIQSIKQTGLSNSETVSKENTEKGKLGIAVAGGEYTHSSSSQNDQTYNSMSQEAISTVYSDYAVDIVTNELEKNKLLKLTVQPEEGTYVQLTSSFELIDPASMGSNINRSAFKEMLKWSDDSNNTDLKEFDNTFNLLESFSTILNDIFPNSIILKIHHALVIANTENLRMTSAQLRMLSLAQRKITILGKIESQIDAIDPDEVFQSFTPQMIPQFFSRMGFFVLSTVSNITKNDRLIKPLAIYFN
ncbi:hypothetical protein IMAU30002_01308 [Lactobacillus helveticus]|uniref:DUF6414 family protein n=2 Tax=Lactobacillus helveticus TaxID=1587 RepID=UPI0015625CCC|nr:hypothetical protein [Lactobacillus helveticus]NRO39169.1 hypothetical protein [Lactobacillus helveticus]